MYWLAVSILLPYFICILKIYFGLRKLKPFKTTAKEHNTKVSVIIACRNEENNLPHILDCLKNQDYDASKYEVIVVNDGSTDDTMRIAFQYEGIRNLNIQANQGSGKKQAVRTGVEVANGELMVTCDADCFVQQGWLTSIVAFYEANKCDMMICPVAIQRNSGVFPAFQELEFLSLQGITAGTAANGNPVMCNAANLAFTKTSYLRYSFRLFDNIPSGDDIFLLFNMKRNRNRKIMWLESPDAIVNTMGAESLKSFFSQRARWISKVGVYDDFYAKILALITLVAVLLQITLFCMSMVNTVFLKPFIVVFVMKSIPDILILCNTARRYGRLDLMKWFLPVQFFYPVYILGVICKVILNGFKAAVNF